MARIISIVNQKGGTGKSACTANLAVGLAQKNMKVLIVDADPQSDVSAGFGYRDCDDSNETLTALMDAVMKDEDIPSDCYIRHQAEGIDIICSNIGLAGTEVQLVNAMSREYVLKQILYGIKDQYDAVIIDCMPSLGMITINALAASDEVLIPVEASYLPIKGLQQLLKTIGTALDITYHPEDIAYLIYTSGSTGVPKGVVITQSAVMNTVLDINQKFSIDNTDKIIGLSSMCFDLSVYDIFGSLSTGAKLVEIEDIHDISYLERIVEKEGITVWNSVPAIMEMFLNGIGNERLFPTINTVLLSGDWIPVNMPNAIKKVCENARVVSLGGATEGSIWSIYYPVDYVDPEWKSIPYGKPLANQTYYVLNYEGRECPVGVSGELYIGGKGVAQGYFKDQEKTNKAFIVHPKYGRIYRTGDYGVLLKSGIIIFQGRKDSQIKIRGHRIEIGEIENQLLKHPKVKNCVVVDWEDDLGKKYLCGYFVSENNIFNCAAIVSHLGLYEVMYKSNVLTCSNILKFAEKKKNIKIFHISTKHVGFGSVPDKKEVLFSESEFNVGQVIDNNYAKTKYEAETLMRAARDEGYNINIFRMGNISCELKGGKFQKNIEQNAFYILTRSFLRLGILPLSEQKTVDLTYVDSAARAIYLLATRKNLNNETYHIENTELLSFTHMGKMIQKYGENVVLRPYEDMWDYFLPIYEEGTDNSKMQEINNLIAYIDFLPWHMPTMFRFVKDKTKILLEKMGFAWKEPDQEIIDNLLDYGKQVGFFD